MKHSIKLAFLCLFAGLFSGCLPESKFKVALKLEDETTGKPIADAWVITVAEVNYAPLREEPYNKAVAAARGITGKNGKLRLKKVEGIYFGQEPKDQLWLMLESRKPKVDRQITAIRGGSIFVFSKDHGFLHQPFAVTETDPEYRGWYGGNETFWNRKTIKLAPETIKKNQPVILKWKVPDDPMFVKGAFQTEFLANMMSGMTEKTGATLKEKEALYNFFVKNMEEAARTSDDPFYKHEYENLSLPEVKKEVINWQLADAGNHESYIHEWLTQKALERLRPEYAEVKQYAEAVKQGVTEEDAGIRFVHHFYNPAAPESAILKKDTTLKWGAIGCPDNPDNEWDLEDAARYYRAGDKEKAYRALGHVIHLLEDLSAPMHTRMIAHDKVFHSEAARFETYFSELIKKNANSLPPEYWQTTETIKPATDIKQLFENTARLTFGSFTQDGQTVNFNDYYAPNKFIKNPDNQTLELMGKYLFPKTIAAGAALMGRFYDTLHPDLSAQKPAETATDAGQPAGTEGKEKTKQDQNAATSSAAVALSSSPAHPWEVSPAEMVARKAKAQERKTAWDKLSPIEKARRSSGIIVSRKVDISPVKLTDGIKTGLVIVYGHIIPPPYKVTVKDKTILVNGVQVDPSLIEERNFKIRQSGSGQISKFQHERYRRLEEVDKQVLAIYRSGVDKKPTAQIKSEIMELLRKSTDVYLNPAVGDTGYSGELAGAGGLVVSMQLTKQDPPKVADSVIKKGEQSALNSYVSMIEMDLKHDRCIAFVSTGYTKGLDKRRLKNVSVIIKDTGISPDERIEKLKTQVFHDYEVAFQVIENYQADEWEIFKRSDK